MLSPRERSAADRKRLIVETSLIVLKRAGHALSATKIRDLIRGQPDCAALTERDIENALSAEASIAGNDIGVRVQGRLRKYFFQTNATNQTIDDGELSLYAPFCRLLREKGYRASPLDHRKANKGNAGENFWTFPDVIAYRSRVAGAEEALIGYELKLKIVPGNIRASLFECLSNSFWANERYVVAPSVDAAALEVFQKIARRYPVGLIEIVTGSLREMTNLRILLECSHAPLDAVAVSELRASWNEFDNFFKSADHPSH